MDYLKVISEYGNGPEKEDIKAAVSAAREWVIKGTGIRKILETCFSAIDLTSLNVTDTDQHIEQMTSRTVFFHDNYPDVPNVASVCVYPNFVETAGITLGDSGINITSVGGGFPSSQTFLEVKLLEVEMAVESGADEIDVVINVGQMIAGEYDRMANELELIRKSAGKDVILKVILETGALPDTETIYKASLLAMYAGADFIKTSTGKISVAATPEAAVVMCRAIKDHNRSTGQKTGIKVAGGVRTPEDALLYYYIVENVLGEEWCNPKLFRIGASSAANNILGAITGRQELYF